MTSFVWIPSLKVVVAGDIVYSGVYVWTAETDGRAPPLAATLDRKIGAQAALAHGHP